MVNAVAHAVAMHDAPEKRLATEPTYRYKAFISYSHRDEKWASWLHRAIETYRVPKHLVGQQTAMGVIPARTSPVFVVTATSWRAPPISAPSCARPSRARPACW